MANLFVKPTGNDANSGASYALAKATITAAQTAAVSGDSIIIASGRYNESANQGGGKSLTYIADGIVTLDGAGLASGSSAIVHGAGDITMRAASTGGRFIVKNYNPNSTTIGAITKDNITAKVIQLSNVEIYGNSLNQVGFNGRLSAGSSFSNCVFANLGTTAILPTSAAVQFVVSNCTFYNCGIGIDYSSGTGAVATGTYIHNNIFHTLTRAIILGLEPSFINCLNSNLYFNISAALFRRNNATAVDYTTLASLQALNPAQEQQGVIANPNFVDASNNIFFLKFPPAIPVGAYGFGLARGSEYDPDGKWNITGSPDNSGWYSADGNITQNGTTGDFELTGATSAVIDSPVFDLGAVGTVNMVQLAGTEIFPTNVIDQTNTSIPPNYQSISIRASATTFAQDASSPSWVEVNRSTILSGITGRFIQIRLVLRNNGVAS